jgi:M6 family metalloprotease-like protein
MKNRILILLLILSTVILASCSHTHVFKGEWHSDVDGHYKLCECGEKSKVESHIGGTASETEKAVCTVCNEPYGKLLPKVLSAPTVSVDENGLASWSAIENSSGYICVVNGVEKPKTSATSIQLSDGDTLTVKAYGDGEAYSDSEASNSVSYIAVKELEAPTVTVSKNGKASWTEIANATGYICSLNGELLEKITDNEITLSDGDILAVKAVGNGGKYLDSAYSEPVKYVAPKPLSAPNVSIDKNGLASWSAIENSSGYICVVNGVEKPKTSATSIQLSDGDSLKVKSVSASDDFLDSGFCSELKYEKSSIYANVKDFSDMLSTNGPMTDGCLPSLGSPRVLVVPINLDSSKATSKILNDIEVAFNGTSNETGWESVKSYYYKSSYGKLNLTFDVLDEWYEPKNSMSYYNSYYTDYADGSTLLLDEVLEYYDATIDFSDYDYNGDGYIDAVWLIYNCDVDYDSNDSLYWAFQSWSYSEETYDECCPYYYAFAGTDFMYEEEPGYDNTNIKVDAHSYIHETGHLMGLDDYYDYDENTGADGGMYYADMMDGNIGDHSSVSKLLLNWIDPTVITGEGEILVEFTSFTETGFVVLIASHSLSSIYDEYFLIEFYTGTGLNENDEPVYDDYYEYDGAVYGIRILHVDANICYNSDGEVDLNGGNAYESGFKYDNSDESRLFVDTMCKDEPSDFYATPEILFTDDGVDFGIDVFKTYKYHDGTALNFTLEIVEMDSNGASVLITMK